MDRSDLCEARVGDEISVESHRLRGARRTGVICELLGAAEEPYFRVRWQDGRETLFHPGSDARLLPKGGRRQAVAQKRSIANEVAQKPKPPPRKKRVSRPMGLRANPGDRLVIKGHHLGELSRDAEVLEVLGPDGSPPFRVRWSDSGREGVLFPGTDAVVEHFRHPSAPVASVSTRVHESTCPVSLAKRSKT